MQNITTEINGDKLTITIDLSAARTISKSGKNAVIASTKGNRKIDGGAIVLGVNCYTATN